MMELTHQQFEEFLSRACSRETSFDPEKWTPENYLWGHCAVVSLLANDCFGGGFLRAALDNTPFADVGSHYWNVLADGVEKDFTRDQFGDVELRLAGESAKSDGQLINREYLLKNPETRKRYELLKKRFELFTRNQTS